MLTIAVAGLAGMALRQPGWRPGDAFLGVSYDSLHALASPWSGGTSATSEVAIVYLDLHSHLLEKQDPTRPWPRDLHARLIHRLSTAGASAIVFDIVFSGPGPDPRADTELASAIRESRRVFLAGQAAFGGDRPSQSRDSAERWLEIEAPWPALASGAVAWGLANHRVDDDFVIRRHFPGVASQNQASLAWSVAAWRGVAAARDPEGIPGARDRWIRYYGPPLTVPHVSYARALRPDEVPDTFFRDRIVFVGARPMAGLFHERQDEFRSPFRSWRDPDRFMPGVEVHATELLNLLRHDWLRRSTGAVETGILLAIALVGGALLFRLRPAGAAGAALVFAVATPLGAGMAFRNGTWFPWMIVSGIQIPVLLAGSWLAHFRDWYVIRRHLEAERRAAEARIREQAALIDKANDAILVHDLEGQVLYLNPCAERLYGWTLAECGPGHGARLTADPEAWAVARAASLAQGEWRGELQRRTKTGRPRVVESRWTLIRNEQGAPKSLLVIDTDVTEKRQLEAESLRLQRAEAVGALASGMAHDLNNALAPVLMGSQILARTAATEETRRVLGLMEAGTRRGVDMVRQVLFFARGGPGERRPISLEPLAREMEKLARTTFPRNIAVTLHAPAGLWPVLGNPTELHQVLLNLCVNARDAMPGGGSLDLSLENLTLDSDEAATLRGGRPGDFVCLLVADSGMGIPAEVLPRIFEPFFTTKPEGVGTGLGLSTTARIVKGHEGFLDVTSTPGEGTTFEVYLPRASATVAADRSHKALPPPLGQGECLLVADDDLAVLEMLRRGLVEHGYRVLAASGGAEAVASFAEHSRDIAAVLCDVDMPGLDGPQTAAVIRATHPDIPWLFMSGSTPCAATPADIGGPLLPKPVSLDLLLRRIRDALDTTRPPG